ncbi:translation elongation factor [Aureococcus anophagefferens]|uniref:Translation elongation factor n=1 Tax=Aureococcus anophagefferens TaxID=44056 RepID=A0ABR1GE71_AURAN
MGLSTVEEVDAFMLTHSYVSGYAFSPADVEVFGKISLPDAGKFPQAYRWYIHIAALTGVKCLALTEEEKAAAAKKLEEAKAKAMAKLAKKETMSMDAIIEEITEEAFADEVQSMTMTSMSLL